MIRMRECDDGVYDDRYCSVLPAGSLVCFCVWWQRADETVSSQHQCDAGSFFRWFGGFGMRFLQFCRPPFLDRKKKWRTFTIYLVNFFWFSLGHKQFVVTMESLWAEWIHMIACCSFIVERVVCACVTNWWLINEWRCISLILSHVIHRHHPVSRRPIVGSVASVSCSLRERYRQCGHQCHCCYCWLHRA